MAKTKAPRRTITFDQQMRSVVRINEAVTVDAEGDTFIRLKIGLRLSRTAKLVGLIYKVRDYKKYLLTDFNCTLYRLIQAKPITVRALIRWLADREKLTFFEARNLVLDYVANLMRRALVVVEVPKAEEEEAS